MTGSVRFTKIRGFPNSLSLYSMKRKECRVQAADLLSCDCCSVAPVEAAISRSRERRSTAAGARGGTAHSRLQVHGAHRATHCVHRLSLQHQGTSAEQRVCTRSLRTMELKAPVLPGRILSASRSECLHRSCSISSIAASILSISS